jgi:hypothetical protein
VNCRVASAPARSEARRAGARGDSPSPPADREYLPLAAAQQSDEQLSRWASTGKQENTRSRSHSAAAPDVRAEPQVLRRREVHEELSSLGHLGDAMHYLRRMSSAMMPCDGAIASTPKAE